MFIAESALSLNEMALQLGMAIGMYADDCFTTSAVLLRLFPGSLCRMSNASTLAWCFFLGLHFSICKNIGTYFNIMAAFARHNLPIGCK